MAESEIHQKKRKKNLTMLGLILGWCLLIFLVTMVKMAQAHDTANTFLAGRQNHLAVIDETARKFAERNALHQQNAIGPMPAQWWENWEDKLDPEKKGYVPRTSLPPSGSAAAPQGAPQQPGTSPITY